MKAKFLPAGQIKVYEKWTEAPLGRVLQITAEINSERGKTIEPFFALRVGVAETPLDKLQWLVGLLGDDRGRMVSSEDFRDAPALDITELVEVGVDPALPQAHSHKPQQVGLIFPVQGGLAMKSSPTPGVDCYILLGGSNLGKSSMAPTFPTVTVGQIGIRWKEEGKNG